MPSSPACFSKCHTFLFTCYSDAPSIVIKTETFRDPNSCLSYSVAPLAIKWIFQQIKNLSWCHAEILQAVQNLFCICTFIKLNLLQRSHRIVSHQQKFSSTHLVTFLQGDLKIKFFLSGHTMFYTTIKHTLTNSLSVKDFIFFSTENQQNALQF